MKENDICKEFNHKCSRCMKDAPTTNFVVG